MANKKQLPFIEKAKSKDPVKAAQELLQAENEKAINEATNEFNSFYASWKQKHGCEFIVSGQFQGNQIQTGLQIIKVK